MQNLTAIQEEYHTLHHQKSRTLQLKQNVIPLRKLDPMNSSLTPLYETGNQRKFINSNCFHLNQYCRGFGTFQHVNSSRKTDLNRAPTTSHNDYVLGLFSQWRHYSGNNKSNNLMNQLQHSFRTIERIYGNRIPNVQLNFMRSFHQKIQETEHQQTIGNKIRSSNHGIQETQHYQPIKNNISSFHHEIQGAHQHQQLIENNSPVPAIINHQPIKNKIGSFYHRIQETPQHQQLIKNNSPVPAIINHQPIKNKIGSFYHRIQENPQHQQLIRNKSIVPAIINQSQRHLHTSHSSLQTTKDYYKILGVPRKSTEAQIKKAYFMKAKQYHPDHNKDPEAKKKFQELSEAYVVLGDRKSRALYDPKFRKATTSRSTPRAPMNPSPAAVQGAAPQGSGFSNILTTAATAIVASELYRKAMSMGQNPAEASDQQQPMDAESAQKIYEDVEKEQKAGLAEDDEEIEETMDAINDGEYDDENDDDSGEFGDFGDSDDFGGGDDSPPDFGSDSSGDKFI
ncbi:uncharacterized protein LOC111051783 [Nilaparvata lugens]|uniref:uncharacterized protein LOC111051783 n=1 Tax=Nilaparvata lugens TaxID=108931 RepID=UPI00193D4BCB|nr:uncharacterized protein LOC111051783 [Nilaparvata lugens]